MVQHAKQEADAKAREDAAVADAAVAAAAAARKERADKARADSVRRAKEAAAAAAASKASAGARAMEDAEARRVERDARLAASAARRPWLPKVPQRCVRARRRRADYSASSRNVCVRVHGICVNLMCDRWACVCCACVV